MSLFNVLKTIATVTGVTSGSVSGSTKVVYKTTLNVAKATGTVVVNVDYKELKKVVRDNHISTDHKIQRAAGTLPSEVRVANEAKLLELIEGK